MDFIKNIYKSIDTEKNFMYRKNIKFLQQSACLFFLLKEAKAAPEKQDRNDLPGKDEHHDYYFKETGRRSKDQRIKERDGRAGTGNPRIRRC